MTQGNEALQLGLGLRDQGLDQVESHNLSWVEQMRRQARKVCMMKGHVTTDDLRDFADAEDLQPTHQNAWGSIFRGKHWKPVGRCRSTRAAAHGRTIITWVWR